MSVPQNQYKVIAGKAAGNKVVAKTPQIATACAELAKMARDGNYWARVSVNYINALTSRQMKTVFVREGAKTADNRQLFVMLMPGISMEFSQHNNSDYLIHSMVLDTSYSELQKGFEKPGLFRVKKGNNNEYQSVLTDHVLADKGRIVTVSDQHPNTEIAAAQTARSAKGPRDSYTVDRIGFDMHFTPGIGNVSGLMKKSSQNPEDTRKVHESALLLAKSMQDSRSIDGVYWISEAGGSAILTRALQVLKSRNVSFDGSGHHVFFSGPRTDLLKAQELALDLKLQFERKAYSIKPFAGAGGWASIKAPWQRRKRDPNNYSLTQMGVDMCKGPQAIIGGVALASSLGLGGVGGFIIGAGVAGFTALAAVTKAVSPNTHDKIQGKL